MRSKNFELNLNIEFGIVVVAVIISNRKGIVITCSIPHPRMRDRNHPVTSMYPAPVKNIYI